MARKTKSTKTAATTETTAPATEQEQTATAPEATTAPATTTEAKPIKPLPTPEEALAAAREANPERYSHVIAVTEQTTKGAPKRVIIVCTDPQTKRGPDGQQVSVCEGEREIATQDLFQVRCCAACAERLVRIARRERTKARDKAARALLRASKAA